jgi:hypothetical protein
MDYKVLCNILLQNHLKNTLRKFKCIFIDLIKFHDLENHDPKSCLKMTIKKEDRVEDWKSPNTITINLS